MTNFAKFTKMLQNAPPCGLGWIQRFQKDDRPDFLVRQTHFRRDWKVSAIRDALPCGWGASPGLASRQGWKLSTSFDQSPFPMIKRIPVKKNSYDIEFEIEGFHWWFATRRKLLGSILSTLKLSPNCTTLDIGCGVGSNLRILRALELHAIGLDQSLHALSLASKKLQLPLINGDLNALPIRPNSVGLIIAMDILEHLQDDANGIRELYRALKEGGILIVTVPAFQFLWGIQDFVTGHKRRYSRKEILNKLGCEKFEVSRSFYFNFFLFFPIFFARRAFHLLGLKIRSENEINLPFINFLLKAIFSLEPFILKFISFPFGVSILCIARKKYTPLEDLRPSNGKAHAGH